ncbi:MAG TPA: enoyl-CoA hydratase-related protein, partial [Streptosporangiaceae bacterium]|nr:enoyl-CoA hydratase-related protein [Streptosporangiaceae bacterium]
AASRYYLTGETFDAVTAARIGLITEAVADIDAGTLAVLELLRAASPQSLRETKPLLTAAVLDDFDTKAEGLAELSARLFGSAEAAEGMAAFLEKRRPSFAAG